ncbi:membrane protein [Bacteroidia bacterium]|nr:membrane protein [Bacteroidia bacterium]GHV46025.1 membrane protein [Bacteroidia bacterium]
MVLSRLWSAFVIVAVVVASIKFFAVENYRTVFNDLVVGESGDTVAIKTTDFAALAPAIQQQFLQKNVVEKSNVFYQKIDENNVKIFRVQHSDGIIGTAKTAVEISLGLIGIMTLFMGFMSIAEKAGGIRLLSRLIQPFFSKLFPEVPKNHPAFGLMTLNFSANLLGLDNAATPFGLRAMESLQQLNPDKTRASNAQIMFLCLHASGLTLIPVSIIAIRAAQHSANPTEIFLPTLIATFCATMAAMIIVSIKQKINLLQPITLAFIGTLSAIIGALVCFLVKMNNQELDTVNKLISNGLILIIFFAIVIGGVYKKINVFDSFIDGAKEGFYVCVRIIPYLVGMLVAISLLRTSGVFDLVINFIKNFTEFLGADPRFVDGLPTALIKPFSGSAARGMMVDTITTFGVDSFPARLSAILQGSSDTTFYVIAVYFGAVGVKNTRYTIGAMLLADFVGISVSIIMAYLFFG